MAGEDFYIFDVSDPTIDGMPLMNGDGLETGPGLVAVKVVGRYAYVANTSSVHQMQVIDILDLSNPVVVFESNDLAPDNTTAVGNSIFYNDRKIYLGLTKSEDGPEFFVFDISSTPAAPTLLGSFEFNTKVNAITVKNDIAYVATPMPTPSPPDQEILSVLDVSTPSAITRLTTFTWPIADIQGGLAIYYGKDDRLYFGRTAGGAAATDDEFFILDPDPADIATPIASKFIPDQDSGKAISIGSIIVRDHLIFMLTGDSNLEFQIWDKNNLGSATPYGSLNPENTSTAGFDCEDNLLFIGQRGNDAIQVVGPYIP